MKANKTIFPFLDNLSLDDKQELINYLKESLFSNDLDKFRCELYENNRPNCPKCSSSKVIKNGYNKNVQKYVCKECTKTFSLHTGTSVHKIHHKNDWVKFIDLTIESKSIRHIAKELNHSKQTIFDWRHKLLSSISEIFKKEFKGVVEMDDVLFRFNQKGRKNNFIEKHRRTKTENGKTFKIKNRKRGISNDQMSVLMSVDRYRTIDLTILKVGKIDLNSLNNVISNKLDRFNPSNIFVTDGCKSYKNIFSSLNFTHEELVLRKGKYSKGHLHLNTLNSFSGILSRWISNSFKSVATKYLKNYLNYFKMIFFVLNENKTKDFLKFNVSDNSALYKFRNIEHDYNSLIA